MTKWGVGVGGALRMTEMLSHHSGGQRSKITVWQSQVCLEA